MKIILVDGNNLMFRSYMPPLFWSGNENSKGFATNAYMVLPHD